MPGMKKRANGKIISDPEILGGTLIFEGTRVPVANILAEIEAGSSRSSIFKDYPSLPLDAIEVCVEWASRKKTTE